MNGSFAETRPHVVLLQAMPDRSTAHGWQLRRIPNQNQTTLQGQGSDQGLGERKIEHGHLIDHQQIQLERSIRTPPKSPGAGFQPAMQCAAGQWCPGCEHRITQEASRLASRSGKADAQIGMPGFRPTQQFHHRAGLAGSRPTTEQNHRGMIQGANGSPLLCIESFRQHWSRQRSGHGWRKAAACHQSLNNLLHRLQPAAPTNAFALNQQGRSVSHQPATGFSEATTLRSEGQRQLPLFESFHQLHSQRFQLRRRQRWRNPPAEGVVQAS